MKRTLTLKTELLTELTADELGSVLGGDIGQLTIGNTCPLIDCVNSRYIPCTV